MVGEVTLTKGTASADPPGARRWMRAIVSATLARGMAQLTMVDQARLSGPPRSSDRGLVRQSDSNEGAILSLKGDLRTFTGLIAATGQVRDRRA